jgi:hypothetical protein
MPPGLLACGAGNSAGLLTLRGVSNALSLAQRTNLYASLAPRYFLALHPSMKRTKNKTGLAFCKSG